MRKTRTTRRTTRRGDDGVNLVGEVNAVLVSQSGYDGGNTGASSRQRVRIVQRNGRTEVTETVDTDAT